MTGFPGVLDLSMTEKFTPATQRFLETLPMPTATSKWDTIFLDPTPDFALYLAWYWATFISPDGELHGQNR